MNEIENSKVKLQEHFHKLIPLIGRIQIGSKAQFPYGWGNTTKGRTIAKILEEIIVQNVKKNHLEIGISKITTSASPYTKNFLIELEGGVKSVYLDFKAEKVKKKTRKNKNFEADAFSHLYDSAIATLVLVATFYFKCYDDMFVEIESCSVSTTGFTYDEYFQPPQ